MTPKPREALVPAQEVERRLAAIKPWVDRCPRDRYWVFDVDKGRPAFRDAPFTDARLRAHLEGRGRFGLGQMAPGSSTTRVAVIDFDDHDRSLPAGAIAQAVRAVADALELIDLHPTIWTSGGGVGAHIYLIWDEPQDAYSVRALLRDVIDATPREHQMLIEVYPKQDRLTASGEGARGSMVWLPFNRASTPWAVSSIGWVDWRPSDPVPEREPPPAPAAAAPPTPALERLRDAALVVAHNNPDPYGARDEWRNFVFAIHAATEGSEEGFALADEFSALVPNYDGPGPVRALWDSASLGKPNAVGAEMVLKRAELAGWRDPAAIEDISDLVEASPTPPAPVARRTGFVDMADLLRRPPTRWHIKGILPQGDLVVLYGASGSGKSFLALDLCRAIALGLAWRERKVTQGRVLYIAAEGTGGFPARARGLEAQGVDWRAVGPAFRVYEGAPSLLDPDAVARMQAIIEEDRRANGPASLIVIDTFAQVLAGGNENAGEDVGLALRALRRLGATAGATVLLVHHSGKDEAKGARGWSGLRAAADAELEVTRDADTGLHGVRVTKQKDGADGLELGFRLRVVETGALDADGDPETSCVLDVADAPEPKGEEVRGKWASAVVRVLEGVGWSSTVGHLIKGVKAITEPHLDNRGSDRRAGDVHKALASMAEKGLIQVRGNPRDDAAEVVALQAIRSKA